MSSPGIAATATCRRPKIEAQLVLEFDSSATTRGRCMLDDEVCRAPVVSRIESSIMGEAILPFAVILASVILASSIVCAARTIARAILWQPIRVPHSAAGYAVEPSGIPVEPETHLETGSAVLAFSHGRWWRAEVIALEGEEWVRVHYPGWDRAWDTSLRRSELQIDPGIFPVEESLD
jgi:hypothetical protein